MLLWKTTGDFQFMVKTKETDDDWVENRQFKLMRFTDLKDIPEDFEYIAITKFLPDVPPAPHSVQEHEQMMNINELFQKYLKGGSL